MTTARQKIHELDEYQEIAGQQGPQPKQVQDPRKAVEPVMSFEKTDVQFWLMIAQTILLFLIWQEMKGGG